MAVTTLRLYGPMGARFGRHHRFDLDSGTVQEAMAALQSQVRGVREYLTQAKSKGIEFAVFIGKRNIGVDQLDFPANAEIRIAPVPVGAKRAGVLQTIVGIVIIAVATIYGGPGGGAAAASWYSAAMGAGIAMVAGGIVQMLTPVPHGTSAKDAAAGSANYNFNGPVNTQAQGNPVPLCYGRLKVGSAVGSAGIDTNDTSTSHYGTGTRLGDMGGGGGTRVAQIRTGVFF